MVSKPVDFSKRPDRRTVTCFFYLDRGKELRKSDAVEQTLFRARGIQNTSIRPIREKQRRCDRVLVIL